jgi:hypothetical protein
MLTEEADLVKEGDATGHSVVTLGLVGAGIYARDGATAFDNNVSKRASNYPAYNSNAIVGSTIADKKEGVGLLECLVELLGRSCKKTHILKERDIVVWKCGKAVVEFGVDHEGLFWISDDGVWIRGSQSLGLLVSHLDNN